MATRSSSGFTLIELLVVIGIVGILASIAISSYGSTKQNAMDARAQADLKSAASAQEAYYIDHSTYGSCGSTPDCELRLAPWRASNGVLLTITATTTGFAGTASHPSGTGTTYAWDSNSGGMQR